MNTKQNLLSAALEQEERSAAQSSGMLVLLVNLLLMIGGIVLFVLCIVRFTNNDESAAIVVGMIASLLYISIIGPVIFGGLKILKPNEALVLTLFGKYYGSLKRAGFYFVNPFVSPVSPAGTRDAIGTVTAEKPMTGQVSGSLTINQPKKTISLKAMTLNNDKQKINDALGNPIVIGIVVIWKVVNTAKAVFNVDNYAEYLSIQCDSALRNIVRLYPYDSTNEEQEKSLRGSSTEVAAMLKDEIQGKASMAGIEILEARITHLSYAPEIAAVMLQRQQASAVIAARSMIVEGAVGMVEMALARLSSKNIVNLDEERKAAMVSNLLVVLCGNRETQPIVNAGSIY